MTELDTSLRDGLVLVVGCPRSGTTWLTNLLLTHAEAGGPPHSESRLFSALQPFANVLERSTTDGPLRYIDEQALVAALRRFCDDLLGAVRLEQPSVRRVIEKTPEHAFQLPFINRLYPDAWYIHIVRDGRDVARSVHEVEFGHPDVAVGAGTWVETLDAVDRAAPALTRFREVRYEQLLDDPVGGVADLLSWVGLAVDDNVRERLAEQAGVRVSQYNTAGQVGAGKWRSLTAAQLTEIYRVAGDVLVARGYAEPDEVTRALGSP